MIAEVDEASFLESREDRFGGRAGLLRRAVLEGGEVDKLQEGLLVLYSVWKWLQLTGMNRLSSATAESTPFCAIGSV